MIPIDHNGDKQVQQYPEFDDIEVMMMPGQGVTYQIDAVFQHKVTDNLGDGLFPLQPSEKKPDAMVVSAHIRINSLPSGKDNCRKLVMNTAPSTSAKPVMMEAW